MKKLHETNKDYILEILQEEEGRLIDKLFEIFNLEQKYLFSRYLAVINELNDLEYR